MTDARGHGPGKRRRQVLPPKAQPLSTAPRPAVRDGTRKTRDMTWTVYSSLRESILNGALPPGESLSQVQLASQLVEIATHAAIPLLGKDLVVVDDLHSITAGCRGFSPPRVLS